MNMKLHMRTRITFLLMSLTFLAVAQKELTLEDAVLKQRSELGPKLKKNLKWIGETDYYSYIEGDKIMRGTLGKSADLEMVSLETLKKAVGPNADDMKRLPSFTWVEPGTMRFTHAGVAYLFIVPKTRAEDILNYHADAQNREFSPDGLKMAYTIGDDLYIAVSERADNIQITDDGGEGIVNGQAVHRYEFGITKGTFWSPDGNYLAFYKKDESMVPEYPLVDITTTPASLAATRYPMAGQPSHHVKLGIYDLKNDRTFYLNTGEPTEQYLTNIGWDPSEKYAYIAHINRGQNHMRLVKYDIKTGDAVASIIEEKHDKYVEPERAPIFLEDHQNQFLWFSERDGFDHIYLYNTKGEMKRQLTKGEWVVKEYLGMDESGKGFFVSGTGKDPTRTHLYRIDIASGESVQLTKGDGSHRFKVNKNGKYILDSYSSVEVPGKQLIIDQGGSQIKMISNAANPLADIKIGSVELFTIDGDNAMPLHCRMIKPSNFDPAKKYPVLVYLYNGPHLQLVTDRWLGGAPLWMFWMAEQGYIIFSMDGRGSKNRGLEFENAVFRNLGTLEMEDQLRGVEYLKSQAFVDGDRMAIHGWSYGGFMTTSFMLRNPGIFQVGVAGGPVIDWKYYEIMYTERYMDTPQENPDGYDTARLTNYVGNLEGDLLIINGSVDDVVVPQHSMSFLKQCVEEDIQVDYFTYPMHPHNVRGKDRLHLMQKVLGYVIEKMP